MFGHLIMLIADFGLMDTTLARCRAVKNPVNEILSSKFEVQ